MKPGPNPNHPTDAGGEDPPRTLSQLEESVAGDPRDPFVRRLFAERLQQEGHYLESSKQYAEVFRAFPTDINLFQNFGFCCQQTGENELAEKAYKKCLALGAKSAELFFNLGAVLLKQQRLPEARAEFHKSLELHPGFPSASLAIANTFTAQGNLESATDWLKQEIKLNPSCAEASINLGAIYQELNQIDQAVDCYSAALQIHPNNALLHFNRAISLLTRRDYSTGWKEYEWRWDALKKAKPLFAKPEWDGSNPKGKSLLVYPEQGLGDIIMFARFAPLAAQLGARVTVQCQLCLQRLLQTLPGVESVMTTSQTPTGFDLHAPLLSLPSLLRQSAHFQAPAPYLTARTLPETRLPIPKLNGPASKIGLVWAGNPQNPLDRWRSIPFHNLRPLFEISAVQFYSLQLAPEPNSIQAGHGQIIDCAGLLTDFAATASVIRQLDLVISVDTAVAHLAGALGHPVWTLLPYAADWRWSVEGETTHWYPSMTLIRQTKPRDWNSVIQVLAERLSRFRVRKDL